MKALILPRFSLLIALSGSEISHYRVSFFSFPKHFFCFPHRNPNFVLFHWLQWRFAAPWPVAPSSWNTPSVLSLSLHYFAYNLVFYLWVSFFSFFFPTIVWCCWSVLLTGGFIEFVYDLYVFYGFDGEKVLHILLLIELCVYCWSLWRDFEGKIRDQLLRDHECWVINLVHFFKCLWCQFW